MARVPRALEPDQGDPRADGRAGDEVAILLRFEGTGREGIETSMRFINTIEIRDGLAYRFGARPCSEKAVKELGLNQK